MAIELKPRESQFNGAQGFDVYEKADNVGAFDAGPYSNYASALLYFTTLPRPGRGKSGLVLRGFKDIVGHGIDIAAPDIIHEATWIAMAKLMLLEKADAAGNLSVVERKVLSALPIVHVLESGGIKVNQLDIVKRNSASLSQIYHALIQSADRGVEFFDTVLYART